VHAGDLLRWDAESGQRGHVRPGMVRIAHDADPAGLGRQRVAEDDAELGPVVIGEDHVRAVVEVVGDRGDQREPEGGGAGRARLVRLEQQATEPHVGAVSEQVTGDRRGEDGDQRPFGRNRTARWDDGAVGYRAGRVIVVVVRVLSHTASLPS
jgi:hypothetical protein